MVLNTFARSLLAVNTPCYFHMCQIMTHGLIRPKLALYTKIYSSIRRYFTVYVLFEAQWDVVHLVSLFYPARTRETLKESGPIMSSTDRITNYRILQTKAFSLSRLDSILMYCEFYIYTNCKQKK